MASYEQARGLQSLGMWGRGVACALLLLAGGGAGAAGTAKAELPKGLAAAEAAQKLGNVVATAVVSQVVKQAPAAELARRVSGPQRSGRAVPGGSGPFPFWGLLTRLAAAATAT